jgi:small conductance mechanosensitive channel
VWEYVDRILGVVLILAMGWVAVRFLVTPLRRLCERSRVDPSVASFLANSLRSAILVAIFVGILQQLGVQTASLLALLGAAGLAVALSLQGSLANFASGLLVLSFRMVRVGDLIELGDLRGNVTELLPFHVVLTTADNQRITMPNTLLTNSAVRNHSALPVRRVQWTLPLTAQDNLSAVRSALQAQLQADGRVLAEPGPQLYIQECSTFRSGLRTGASWPSPPGPRRQTMWPYSKGCLSPWDSAWKKFAAAGCLERNAPKARAPGRGSRLS